MNFVQQWTLLGGATLFITACASPPPAATFSAADEAAVRALFDSTAKRINAADWTAWAAEFADSAVFQPPNAKALRGREAILAYGRAFPPIEQFSIWDVNVRGEGNIAYATSAVGVKVKDAPADTSKQLVVLRRVEGGRWEVTAISFNSDRSPSQPSSAVAIVPTPAPMAVVACGPAPAQGGTEMRTDEVHFEPGSARLTKIGEAILDEVALRLKQEPTALATVFGYTDGREDAGANQDLDRRRAGAARDYIARQGIGSARVTVVGRHACDPIGDNSTAEGRLRNRRIEVKLAVP